MFFEEMLVVDFINLVFLEWIFFLKFVNGDVVDVIWYVVDVNSSGL